MRARQRSILSVVLLAALAAFALLARRYGLRPGAPTLSASRAALIVTSGADRGPGSLRAALFAADTAGASARVVIQARRITLSSALPPIVNPRGVQISAAPPGAQINAQALGGAAPVFDIDADAVTLSGLTIRGCAGPAILVRAARFRLSRSTLQSCDIGVEVAADATDLELTHDRFQADRIGVRFTAPSRDSELLQNDFADNRDAGVWLVASQAHTGADPINVHDNRFRANGTGIVAGNLPVVIQHNQFSAAHNAAVHLIGAGAIVRDNRISGGKAAGIIAENASGALIEGNELDHLQGYAMLVRGSAGTVLRDNRIESCAYGVGFVLGNEQRPNLAVDNVLIALRYDGFDVIGDSPILRGNQVLQARVAALHTENFTGADGQVVRARPLLERNRFQAAPR